MEENKKMEEVATNAVATKANAAAAKEATEEAEEEAKKEWVRVSQEISWINEWAKVVVWKEENWGRIVEFYSPDLDETRYAYILKEPEDEDELEYYLEGFIDDVDEDELEWEVDSGTLYITKMTKHAFDSLPTTLEEAVNDYSPHIYVDYNSYEDFEYRLDFKNRTGQLLFKNEVLSDVKIVHDDYWGVERLILDEDHDWEALKFDLDEAYENWIWGHLETNVPSSVIFANHGSFEAILKDDFGNRFRTDVFLDLTGNHFYGSSWVCGPVEFL